MHAEAVGGAERVTRDWTAGRWWLAALSTGTQGEGMAQARRIAVWLWLSAVGGGLLLVVVGMVLWMFLPRWAPDWVIDHCPFVEPVVRAWAHVDPAPVGTPESEGGFPGRIEDYSAYSLDRFGVAAVPILLRLLDDTDPQVRIYALRYLTPHSLPEVGKLHDLTRDENPWVRLTAWERLEYEPVEVRYLRPGATSADIANCALSLLNDGDEHIRDSILLHLSRELRDLSRDHPWSSLVRQVLILQVRQSPYHDTRASLRATLWGLSYREHRLAETGKLSQDWLFPLLNLGQAPSEDADLDEFLAEQLPLVEQDFPALYAQLGAMQRGEVPWEPGAQPWMYEQLHDLFTRRVTVALKDVEVWDIIKQCFPQGNVRIDDRIIASAPLPVTLELVERPKIEVLLEMARLLEGRLQLDNGIAHIASSARAPYGTVQGFVPSHAIGFVPGADPDAVTIAKWRKILQRRCSMSDRPVPLAQWFVDLGRQAGLPIDTQAIIPQEWWDVEFQLHELPLEQILGFMSGYCGLRMELGPTGLRILPGDPR